MQPFKYKSPRVNTGDLRTPITFYKYGESDGPEPGEVEKNILYETWAKVESVWLRDLETAKANGTLSDITVTMRDPLNEYIPTNKDYLSIDAPEYRNKRFNIKSFQPDLQNKQFITVVVGLEE